VPYRVSTFLTPADGRHRSLSKEVESVEDNQAHARNGV
jgi:hypothetical protein